jgi:hypothetical protein
MSNTSKEVLDNMMNNIATYKAYLMSNTVQMRKFVKKWRMPLISGLISIIILYIFFSKIYNRETKLTRHLIRARSSFVLESIADNKEVLDNDFRLCDFYIASSYRSFLPGNQYFDIVSADTIRTILECGVRYIELDIFPSSFCVNSAPVVVSGREKGLWHYSNSLSLDVAFKTIKDVAFNNKTTINIREPLFLYLNINANENYNLLKKVADLVDQYFGPRLTSTNNKYKDIFPQTPIKNLFGKVVIISNKKWEKSPMEELINLSPDGESFDKITMRSLNSDQVTDNFDKRELTEYNKRNITRVYPIYNGRSSENYNPSNCWLTGCQIVAFNYQTSDAFLDFYLDFFKNLSMRLKPEPLRFKPFVYDKPPPQNPAVSFAPIKHSTPFYSIVY